MSAAQLNIFEIAFSDELHVGCRDIGKNKCVGIVGFANSTPPRKRARRL